MLSLNILKMGKSRKIFFCVIFVNSIEREICNSLLENVACIFDETVWKISVYPKMVERESK